MQAADEDLIIMQQIGTLAILTSVICAYKLIGHNYGIALSFARWTSTVTLRRACAGGLQYFVCLSVCLLQLALLTWRLNL